MYTKLADVLRSGFFDYAAMLSEIRTPEETAAAVRVLNAVMGLIESTDGRDIAFVRDVIEDIHTMTGIAQKETEY